MAERESLSAQTERLAALMNKRRGGSAGVGVAPKAESAPAPPAAPIAVAPAAQPAPAPAPIAAVAPSHRPSPPREAAASLFRDVAPPREKEPPAKPAREPEAASGGDSLSAYFRALGLEDPFQSGSGASSASASLEDLLAMPERTRPAPAVEPAIPLAPAPPRTPPAPPPAPEPPPVARAAPFAPPEPAPLRPTQPPPVIAIAPEPKPEPLRAPPPPPPLPPLSEDPGDFLDQVSFDEPAVHARHEAPPRPAAPEPSPPPPPPPQAAVVPPPAPPAPPAHEPLDDPAFWDVSATVEEIAPEPPLRMPPLGDFAAAKRSEAERELAIFDSEPSKDRGAAAHRHEDHASAEEEPQAEEGEEEYGAEQPLLEEGEMLMPIDAQRAEMIRHLAQTMGCAPEDVVVTALDWYLDALMNAETSGDDAAA